MEYEHIVHSFEPIFDSASQILILGTLPSVKSRETNFYYGHKQNRFWKVLAALFQEPIPETIDEKKHLLLRHHIAIWDVIQSCDIKGSSDSSIKNVKPTELRKILDASNIKQIYANGSKAGQLYKKYHSNPFELVEITHAEPMWKNNENLIVNGYHNLKYTDKEIIEYFKTGEHWPW